MSEQITDITTVRPEKARPAIVKVGSNVFVALVLAIRTDTPPVFETWRTVDRRWVNERFPLSYEVELLPRVEEEIVAACQRAGVRLVVNQNMRYDHAVRGCRTLIEQGTLGDNW